MTFEKNPREKQLKEEGRDQLSINKYKYFDRVINDLIIDGNLRNFVGKGEKNKKTSQEKSQAELPKKGEEL